MDESVRFKDKNGGEPLQGELQPVEQKDHRKQRKPTAFERRVEARAMEQVTKALEEHLDPAALTEPDAISPDEQASESGPEIAESTTQPESPFVQALRLLQGADSASNPKALRLMAELAELAQGGPTLPAARASHVIQPSGGGLPAPDLRREYENRLRTLRLGDVAGLMEVKREFRKRGLEVY